MTESDSNSWGEEVREKKSKSWGEEVSKEDSKSESWRRVRLRTSENIQDCNCHTVGHVSPLLDTFPHGLKDFLPCQQYTPTKKVTSLWWRTRAPIPVPTYLHKSLNIPGHNLPDKCCVADTAMQTELA